MIDKQGTYDEDFDCYVDTLDDLLSVLHEIREKRGDIPAWTYEQPRISLYVDKGGKVITS